MGLLRMLGLVRLSEYEEVCRARDDASAQAREAAQRVRKANADLVFINKMHTKLALNSSDALGTFNEQRDVDRRRIATLTEANDRLAAKVSELSEALERKGHPLSWPSVTEPEPAVRIVNWLEGDRG